MNVPQLKAFCRRFPEVTETLHEEPYNFLVYAVRGKKFAYFKTSSPERWRFSVRVSPDRFVELTDVPGVKPARYRGRFGWITIVNVSGFPPAYLRELVEWSYRRASSSSTKAGRTGKIKGFPQPLQFGGKPARSSDIPARTMPWTPTTPSK
jgi:predicted DNA-binding protein (MmcQ/YjbR family)